jgi:hypothetical protein
MCIIAQHSLSIKQEKGKAAEAGANSESIPVASQFIDTREYQWLKGSIGNCCHSESFASSPRLLVVPASEM